MFPRIQSVKTDSNELKIYFDSYMFCYNFDNLLKTNMALFKGGYYILTHSPGALENDQFTSKDCSGRPFDVVSRDATF